MDLARCSIKGRKGYGRLLVQHGCLRVEAASGLNPFHHIPGPAASCARQSLIDRRSCQERGTSWQGLAGIGNSSRDLLRGALADGLGE
jgi:hypothetical protein